MKNKDILFLDQILKTVSPPDMKGWFNYSVQETIQMAEAKAISIHSVIEAKGDMIKYQDALKKLQEKHAEKDEYDQPMKIVKELGDGMVMEKFIIADIDDPKCKFNIAAKALAKRYKTAIDEYNKSLEFLEEENPDFEPYWIKPESIPDGLSRQQMKAIILMVEKEDAEPKA